MSVSFCTSMLMRRIKGYTVIKRKRKRAVWYWVVVCTCEEGFAAKMHLKKEKVEEVWSSSWTKRSKKRRLLYDVCIVGGGLWNDADCFSAMLDVGRSWSRCTEDVSCCDLVVCAAKLQNHGKMETLALGIGPWLGSPTGAAKEKPIGHVIPGSLPCRQTL